MIDHQDRWGFVPMGIYVVGNCPIGELSNWGRPSGVLSRWGNCLGWKQSWKGVVLVGSHPGGSCPSGEFVLEPTQTICAIIFYKPIQGLHCVLGATITCFISSSIFSTGHWRRSVQVKPWRPTASPWPLSTLCSWPWPLLTSHLLTRKRKGLSAGSCRRLLTFCPYRARHGWPLKASTCVICSCAKTAPKVPRLCRN